MRTDREFGICIGGPLDGQTREIDSEFLHAMKEWPEFSANLATYGGKNALVTQNKFERMTYRAHRFPMRCDDHIVEIWLWIPTDMPILSALQKLVDGYRKPLLVKR